MPFVFKLQKLLKYKVLEEKDKKNQMFKILKDYFEVCENILELQNDIEKINQKIQDILTQKQIDTFLLETFYKYLEGLKFLKKQQEEKKEEIFLTLEKKKDQILKLMQEKRTIEKIKEKRLREYLKKVQKMEINFLDEVGIFIFLKNLNAQAS